MEGNNLFEETTPKHQKEKTRILKNELKEAKKELQVKTSSYGNLKRQQDDYFQLKKQMGQMMEERNDIKTELLHYKQECLMLREKSKDLEVNCFRTTKDLQGKIHVLEIEVDRLHKENTILKSNAVPIKKHREEIAQKTEELLKERRSCSELQNQIDQLIKERKTTNLSNFVVKEHMVDEDKVAKEVEKNIELNKQYVTLKEQLAVMLKQLGKTDYSKWERQKHTNHKRSQPVPPQTFEDIERRKSTLREQQKKIQTLTGAKNMYQAKVKEYKKDKLAGEAATLQNLNHNKTVKGADLRKSEKSSVRQPCKNKSVDTLPKRTINNIQSQTKKVNIIQLPPSPSTLQLKSVAQSVHTQPKKMCISPIRNQTKP